MGKFKYFLTFLDDYSRKIFIYYLEAKSDVYKCFVHFITFIQKQNNLHIKTLKTENGKEYINKDVKKLLADNGTHWQFTVPRNPESNRRVERLNRTFLDKARCMLQEAGLGNEFWAEAIATASYVANRSPHSSVKMKTPYVLWEGVVPDLSNIRVFGCKANAYVAKELRN